MWKNFFGTIGGSSRASASEHPAAALVGPAALEVLAHRRNVEQRDLVADDMADGDAGLGVLERHKLHVVSPSRPQMRRAARA